MLRHCVVVSLGVLMASAQTPQRTINNSSAPPIDKTARPAEGSNAPAADPLADAYRRQLQKMTDTERKTLQDLNSGESTPRQPGLIKRPGTGLSAGELTPQPTVEDRRANDALSDANRMLSNADAIRDRYIDRAGSGTCPPAIVARMADLKWKLVQKGVVIGGPNSRTEAYSDYVAVGQDWFKAGEPSSIELRQARIEDILPLDLIAAKRTSGRVDDEEADKMRRDYEALAAACSTPQQGLGTTSAQE